MFSKTCEYAIKIMVFIKTLEAKGTHVGLRTIAKEIDSPQAFTAKILQRLVRADLLTSVRGPHGGFKINDQQGPIYLKDIVYAIDGNALLTNCVLGFEKCSSEAPCAVHYKFVEIRDELKKTLSNTHIEEIAGIVASGSGALKLQ
ncbi:Rrf2 family transcriptional regulator [Membranicola marinus]|uniref:Rrf2 family transcriptional regulator n=1 Tax=Membranihabitans marinus TaxID=1227546 RepID=A0A953HUU6_9BACT|nr:Rrf2 family transcriptional regulator [Membranihabitans marinus]MBY5958278.1 Rrf2 family transcriptional regulator [Membranihabitans marinus]